MTEGERSERHRKQKPVTGGVDGQTSQQQLDSNKQNLFKSKLVLLMKQDEASRPQRV